VGELVRGVGGELEEVLDGVGVGEVVDDVAAAVGVDLRGGGPTMRRICSKWNSLVRSRMFSR
jgi:hypothetical protein